MLGLMKSWAGDFLVGVPVGREAADLRFLWGQLVSGFGPPGSPHTTSTRLCPLRTPLQEALQDLTLAAPAVIVVPSMPTAPMK